MDEMYQPGNFEAGNSTTVDQALWALMKMFISHATGESVFDRPAFQTAWQKLLETLVAAFPDISIYNLAMVGSSLTTHELYAENLIVSRFVVELNPASAESQCFLGHAYRKVGDLEAAIACYQCAYNLAMGKANEQALSPSHPIRLDACDYLIHLAETENDAGRPANALIHATRAFNILKNSRSMFKYLTVYETLHRVCLRLGAETLAEQYRLEAEKVRPQGI